MFVLVRTLCLVSMIAGLLMTVVAGAVGALPRRATLSTRGLITTLAADGNRVAVTTTKIRSACDRVVVWTAPRPQSSSIETDTGCGEQTSVPTEVRELALSAGQVAWIEQTGGNSLELLVEVAKLPSGRPKLISHVVNGYGASSDASGDWVGQLRGAGPLLVYNRWELTCTLPTTYRFSLADPALRIVDPKLIRLVAGRGRVVVRGPDSYPLRAVGGGRMVVQSNGSLKVLAADGTRVGTIPAMENDAARAIALDREWLAIERKGTLDLHNPVTGAKMKSIPLGPAATFRLVGVSSKLAVLLGAHRLGFVRLSDGKVVSLAFRGGVAAVVDAKLTAAGLFYAYNLRGTAAKGRVVFEPTNELLALF